MMKILMAKIVFVEAVNSSIYDSYTRSSAALEAVTTTNVIYLVTTVYNCDKYSNNVAFTR